MAAAVSLQSPILFIDEVLAVGDVSFKDKCIRRMINLRDRGSTILYVSHDMESVERLCDRVIVLDDGAIVYEGDTQEGISFYLHKARGRIARQQSASDRHTHPERAQSEIEILEVETLDMQGNPKSVYQSGEALVLRIKFKSYKVVAHPVFRVQIRADSPWSDRSIIIFGTNSERAGYSIDSIHGEGEMLLRYENLPLLRGEYFFRVAILPMLFAKTPFYVCPREASFYVDSQREEGGGLVRISHQWSIQ
jgi:ABC-type glutathione transport system ATPase component